MVIVLLRDNRLPVCTLFLVLLLTTGAPVAAQGSMTSTSYAADCTVVVPGIGETTSASHDALTVAGAATSATLSSPSYQARFEVLCLGCGVTLCGDCNGDGIVSILDALMGARHAVTLVVLTGIQFASCDVEQDGDVDILDALAIAQVSTGLSVTLTCC